MSSQFGKIPITDNLININKGPCVDNYLKELRYATYYSNNPGPIIMESKKNNESEGEPLGGPFRSITNGYDKPDSYGILPDIHPCNTTDIEEPNNINIPKVVNSPQLYEYLKENFSDNTLCYVIISLLILSGIVIIYCKMNKYI